MGDYTATAACSEEKFRQRLAGSVWEAWIRQEAKTSTLRAWYRLSEPSDATVAVDSGPNHHDGTYVGNSQQVGSVPVLEPDQARKFDGLDDYAQLPAGAIPTGTTWTVECWLTVQPFSGNTRLVAVSAGIFSPAAYFNLTVCSADHATPGRVAADVNGTLLVGTSNVLGQDRVHAVLVRDGSTITLHVDGVQQDSDVLSVTTALAPSPSAFIGRNIEGFAQYFPGTIDEVAIWDVALTATQILAHYDAGNSPLSGDSPGARIEQLLDWANWPATDRDLDAGQSSLQSATLGGTVKEALDKVGETEESFPFVTASGQLRFDGRNNTFNRPIVATFGDSSTEIRYADIRFDYANADIFNEVRVTRDGGVQQVVSSTASQDDFGIETFTRSALLNDTDADSREHAQWLLNQHDAFDVRRINLTFHPQNDPATMMPILLNVEIGQWYTIKCRPPSGGLSVGDPISLTGIVQQVSHRIDTDAPRLVTSVSLSPVGTQSVMTLDSTSDGILDTSVLAW